MACECGKVINCPCPKTECENHSKCCDCVAGHLDKDLLPFCQRPENKKKA